MSSTIINIWIQILTLTQKSENKMSGSSRYIQRRKIEKANIKLESTKHERIQGRPQIGRTDE